MFPAYLHLEVFSHWDNITSTIKILSTFNINIQFCFTFGHYETHGSHSENYSHLKSLRDAC